VCLEEGPEMSEFTLICSYTAHIFQNTTNYMTPELQGIQDQLRNTWSGVWREDQGVPPAAVETGIKRGMSSAVQPVVDGEETNHLKCAGI